MSNEPPKVASSVQFALVVAVLGGLVGFVAGGLVHYNFGDSEVVMVFYFLMGLTLVAERVNRLPADVQEGRMPRVPPDR